MSTSSWDSKTYDYKIAESIKPSDSVTDLDQYVFVVRQRIGKYAGTYSNKMLFLTLLLSLPLALGEKLVIPAVQSAVAQ